MKRYHKNIVVNYFGGGMRGAPTETQKEENLKKLKQMLSDGMIGRIGHYYYAGSDVAQESAKGCTAFGGYELRERAAYWKNLRKITAGGGKIRGRKAKPLKVIFDTDIDGDNDDVAAAAILHALADEGKVEILAMGVVSHSPYSPACLDAINIYYGRGDIPIGAYKGIGSRFTLAEMGSPYAKPVADRCPHKLGPTGEVPDVLGIYRQALAAQSDGAVTMIGVGQMNNFVDLLATPPDQYSNLSGCELVRRKVETLFVMAPYFNEDGTYHRAYNFHSSPKAALEFIAQWPTTIKFGEGILGHRHFIGSRLWETPQDNPARIAFEAYVAHHGVEEKRRHCADPNTVLYAVCGTQYFNEVGPGACVVREDGHTRWDAANDRQHYYNTQKLPIEELENVLEELLIRPPKRQK